ncbi:MAG: NUDIX hydrolase [Flavobacteriales bacterium]|nr:NUDIX hydrolase [Flavobacteriales bacterium]
MPSDQRVALTVDAVVTDARGRVLVMERGTGPFRGSWVLPGGYVDPGETVEQACIREVREELGLAVKLTGLIGIYSEPGRDPRGAVVSIAYRAEVTGGTLTVTDEARAHRWLEPEEEVPMGFDHARILADHRAQMRA